jgi:hypothetical protein
MEETVKLELFDGLKIGDSIIVSCDEDIWIGSQKTEDGVGERGQYLLNGQIATIGSIEIFSSIINDKKYDVTLFYCDNEKYNFFVPRQVIKKI